MAPRPLRLDVDGTDVVFTDSREARAAGTRWNQMARELARGNPSPAVQAKIRELRARAKAAHDWARRSEASAPAPSPHGTEPAAATAAADEPGSAPSSTAAGFSARRALDHSGIRRSAKTAQRRARRAGRRYDRAAGRPASGIGDLVVFFLGSIVALSLFSDLLGQRGSAGFSGAASYATKLVHRVVDPVPLVNRPGG